MSKKKNTLIRVRMSEHDAHYAGGLVNGSRMLDLFGDVATELLIRNDGDEGLFVAYDKVEFKAPVYAGDYIEARGRIINLGDTSRRMEFEALKIITSEPNAKFASAATILKEPLLVCSASGTCVVSKEKQRGGEIG
jgi:3-aminobutyryl-CoA ammonia-lyase